MKVLFDAITARYASASGASARAVLGNTMYFMRAPTGTAEPLVTYGMSSPTGEFYAMVNADATTYEQRDVFIDFSIFTNDAQNESPLAIINAGELMMTLYDDVLLTVTGWTTVLAERIGEFTLRGEQDKEWQQVISYHYIVGKAT